MAYTVYIHTNLINNKRYVGITKRTPPCLRWGKYGEKYANEYLRADIGKYGWDKFDHQIVARNLTPTQASTQEQFWVALFNTTDPRFGYNLTKGGFGCVPNERMRKMASERNMGANNPMYGKTPWNKGLPSPSKGVPRSEETKRKISAAKKGHSVSEETRKKLSAAIKGKSNPKNAGANNGMFGKPAWNKGRKLSTTN